jgi:predicted outer membrane lipoprotein
MQTVILSCLFGVVGAMVLWVVGAAAAKRDLMIRRTGKLVPPEEF